jgi:hypothetical protein
MNRQRLRHLPASEPVRVPTHPDRRPPPVRSVVRLDQEVLLRPFVNVTGLSPLYGPVSPAPSTGLCHDWERLGR